MTKTTATKSKANRTSKRMTKAAAAALLTSRQAAADRESNLYDFEEH